jgi:hypothetical protein
MGIFTSLPALDLNKKKLYTDLQANFQLSLGRIAIKIQ